MGTRWLVRSANVQAHEEGVELGRGSVALMLGLTLVAGVGIFFLLPLLVATVTAANVENGLVQHLIEGLVRVGIFLGYLALIGRAPDIRRVFQYHGAEHMTIHALEAGDPLTVAKVRQYPTAHQRCGTEFLVVVILLSIVAFSVVGRQQPLVMVGSRILLIPVIASVGYEILRFGARHRANPIVKVLLYPGARAHDQGLVQDDEAADKRPFRPARPVEPGVEPLRLGAAAAAVPLDPPPGS